jgi:adenosylcobinamide-GDP ribazoletransferase
MRSWRPFHDLALAITLLTAVPLRVDVSDSGGPPSQSAAWFPWVGVALGSLVSATLVVAHRFVYGIGMTGAVLLVVALALLTRMLHWDGLADTADAWFVPRERRLEVMSDTATGAFGATAIALTALLEVSAFVALGATQGTAAAALVALMVARLAATFSAWLGRPAKPGGLGASVMSTPTSLSVVIAVCAVVTGGLVSWFMGAPLLPLVLSLGLGVVLALVTPHLIARRMGGVTGDTMGASVLVVEVGTLIVIAAVFGVLRLSGLSA